MISLNYFLQQSKINPIVEDVVVLKILYITKSCTSLKLIYILLDLQRYIGNIQVKSFTL